jgi:hypothetical protein
MPLPSPASKMLYTYIANSYKKFDKQYKQYIQSTHFTKQKKYFLPALFCIAIIPTSITLLRFYHRLSNTKEEKQPDITSVQNTKTIAVFTHNNVHPYKQLQKEYQANLATLHELHMNKFATLSQEYLEKLKALDITKDSIDTFEILELEYNQAVYELNQNIKQIQCTINNELQLKLSKLSYADGARN